MPGARQSTETTSTPSRTRIASSPRAGMPGIARMRSTLMETATTSRPASAAAAPADATNRSDHSDAA